MMRVLSSAGVEENAAGDSSCTSSTSDRLTGLRLSAACPSHRLCRRWIRVLGLALHSKWELETGQETSQIIATQ